MVEPKDIKNADEIERIIFAELDDLAKNGIGNEEFERGFKKTQMAFYSLIESIQDQAYAIGHTYLATGDENYVFTALEQPEELFKEQIQSLITTYFRPAIMNKGFVLPLPEREKSEWALLQQESDKEDQQILSARERTTEVEGAVYAKTIEVQEPGHFDFPKPTMCTLSNGLKVLYHDNDTTPKINIVLQLKAHPYYDSQDQQGLYGFVTSMMTEGTENYTSEELANEIESRGMSVSVYPGGISLKMLHADLEFGLGILNEIVTKATFPEDEIEKVRHQLLTSIKQYWDEPRSFATQLVRDIIYKGHPYSKQTIGTADSITAITRQDLIDFYNTYISPSGASIAVVGDLQAYDIQELLESSLSGWASNNVETIEFPVLSPSAPREVNYPINRDQVVLRFAQLSIARRILILINTFYLTKYLVVVH